MKTLNLFTVIAVFLIFIETSLAEQAVLQPQSQGDVTFVSGGIGRDEADAMQALRSKFNLHMLFALKSGDYLSEIQLAIFDKKGNSLFETVTLGPMLWVDIKPGTYFIKAQLDGKFIEKKVNVSKNTSLSFIWAGE
jgi:hypothetical protein